MNHHRDGSDAVIGCLLAVVLFLFLGVCFGGCYGCSRWQTSEGYRDGTIRKVSHSGKFWKTWEVEAVGDGIRSDGEGGSSFAPERFRFTVEDEALARRLESIPPGKRVRIKYRAYAGEWAPKGDTSYFITGIEDADSK